MPKPSEPRNPFYGLVIALGVAFLITAFGYGTMAYRATTSAARQSDHALMVFLDRWGLPLMGSELALLGIATAGVMWLDQARASASQNQAGPASDSASPHDDKIG